MAPDSATQRHCAQLYNAGFQVRHYARGARLPSLGYAEKRRAAIRELGLIVRRVFAESDDFEPLLTALVDCLSPRDDWPRF